MYFTKVVSPVCDPLRNPRDCGSDWGYGASHTSKQKMTCGERASPAMGFSVLVGFPYTFDANAGVVSPVDLRSKWDILE